MTNNENINEEQLENTEVEEVEETVEETTEDTVEEVEVQTEEEKLQAELDAMKDRYMRTVAEYDNFKKRTIKEKEEMYATAVCDTIEQILPILDNLTRAVTACEDGNSESLADGVKMIAKQFGEVFSAIGVSEIEALGNEFDPNLHNAVMHVEDESVGDNSIVEEFMKGYTYKDKVIRHSMVKVAN